MYYYATLNANGKFLVVTTSQKCMIDDSYETKLISEV